MTLPLPSTVHRFKKLLIPLLAATLAVVYPGPALAQHAPTGAHYAGRSSDTGHSGPSDTGGYAATVPLELPPARGGLPIPLQISSGARGFGAAGIGWDIPLSFVHVDRSLARRLPRRDGEGRPAPRQRIVVSLPGRQLEMVRRGSDWFGRDAPEVRMREEPTGWTVFDGNGLTYTFEQNKVLAGTGGPQRDGGGMFLLSSIKGAGGSALVLGYDIRFRQLAQLSSPSPSGVVIAVNLTSISYNPHPGTGCFKHELRIQYDNPVAEVAHSFSVVGERVLARFNRIQQLEVMSRASCASSPERLRSYLFSYVPDPDVQQDRLTSVSVHGRQGTAEAGKPITLARYEYGSATVQDVHSRALRYEYAYTVPLPNVAGDMARTDKTSSAQFKAPPSDAPVSSAATHALMDVTGDGRIDLVYQQNGKLWTAAGVATSQATSTFAPGAQLNDPVLTRPVLDARSAAYDRFSRPADVEINHDYTWTQTIDVNGDGRLDIIDAAEVPQHWVVYLNTPSSSPSGVAWVRRLYWIGPLHLELRNRGLAVPANHLPLSRRTTAHSYKQWTCWKLDNDRQVYVKLPPGSIWHDDLGPCSRHLDIGNITHRATETTLVEWETRDINGDGFVDVVFNSSPPGFTFDESSSPEVAHHAPEFTHGDATYKFGFPNETTRIDAVLNVQGMSMGDGEFGGSPFSAPIELVEATKCGVGAWKGPDTDIWYLSEYELPETQSLSCGFVDINGDGLLDRLDSGVALGTGSGFDTITWPMPDPIARYTGAHQDTCTGPWVNSSFTGQDAGLRDVNGDGFPDLIGMFGGTHMKVRLGTGAGFALAVPIQGLFALSVVQDKCDGAKSWTRSGLYDVDGDGKPDVVRLSGDATQIYVHKLAGGTAPGVPEAGRLVKIENGYGAEIRVTYTSAKHDPDTKHQIPSPEIVVDTIETVGTKGFGGTLAATRYAYGDIEMFYDSLHETFRPTGYRRRVEITTTSDSLLPERQVLATIVDRYPLEPVNPFSLPYLSDAQRFGRYLRIGRVSDVTVLAGYLDPNPWVHLRVDTKTDGRRIAATHYDIDTSKTRLITDLPQQPYVPCIDMMFPYDYKLSNAHNAGHAPICKSRGFVYTLATSSWRGTAAPPSADNVATLSSVRSIDDLGRVTGIAYHNDAWRSDDDVCIDTTYAEPIGDNERVYTAIATRKVTNCSPVGAEGIVFAQEEWQYDKLPVGMVMQGLQTAHTVYRHATDTGAWLGTIREYDVDYDALANPYRITQMREDGATRTTTLAYDAFGLAAVGATVAATGLPTLSTSRTVDLVTGELLFTTDENGTTRGTTYDGFGRPLLATVKPPNGTHGVLSARAYLGFDGQDSDGRRVVVKEFTDPVEPASVWVERGRTSTVYLDELGRQRRGVVDLGDDYGSEDLIVGERTYDPFGRIAFEADPYPTSQSASTAYGTTQYFRTDGTPWLSIRGRGPQPPTVTPDPSVERFPTLFQRTFANHLESTIVQTADALTPGSPQFGVVREEVATAIGRVIERSTRRNGTRLEHAQLGYDRLGGLTKMVRFQNPTNASNPVEWTWQFDSIGQVLRLTEPSVAPQQRRYSNFGELLEVTWTPPAPEPTHSILTEYDALGRTIATHERNDNIIDPATVRKFGYDTGVSLSPLVSPTHVLGRLAYAAAPTGTTLLSYDAFGRVNARTHATTSKTTYVERHGFHGDGSQAWIELNLPDNNYAVERVDYDYDSAGQLRWMWYSDGVNTEELFNATQIDPWGRLRSAWFGKRLEYTANFEDTGRRLPQSIKLFSGNESRAIAYDGFDAVGRETSRGEDIPGLGGVHSYSYDALGRLASSKKSSSTSPGSAWTFSYDALGNVLDMKEQTSNESVGLSYQTTDRDRICRVTYTGFMAVGCNVDYDSFGNVVYQPTRAGHNEIDYFNSGDPRFIRNQSGAIATFRYDAFGQVHELDITEGNQLVRSDRRYGAYLVERYQMGATDKTYYLARQFPGPGMTISRRGAKGPWIFQFAEMRGTRFTTDQDGRFVQDLEYSPFGVATSTGARPGTTEFSPEQWNDGDALEQFGLVHMGARLYDPSFGRFLSRDPLLIPRSAATTNPYGFAFNDPVGLSDASGMDPCGGQYLCLWTSYSGAGSAGLVAAAAVGTTLAIFAFHTGVDAPSPSMSKEQQAYFSSAFDARMHQAQMLATVGQFLADDWVSNAIDGIGEGVYELGADFAYMVRHPIQTIEAIDYAITHPVETVRAVVSSFSSDVQAIGSGDARAAAKGAVGVVASVGPGNIVKLLSAARKGMGLAATLARNNVGSYRALNNAGLKDGHHTIQDAAVRDLPGYDRHAAPAVQLPGPSTRVGSPHYNATQVQRQAGGGTYAAERRIGYKALRKAGLPPAEARRLINIADQYFASIGVTPATRTRIPGHRSR